MNCVRPPNVPRSLTGAADAGHPARGRPQVRSTTRFKYSRRGLNGGCPSADAAALVQMSAITVRRHVISETIALLENPAAPWVPVGLDQHNDIRLITPLTQRAQRPRRRRKRSSVECRRLQLSRSRSAPRVPSSPASGISRRGRGAHAQDEALPDPLRCPCTE